MNKLIRVVTEHPFFIERSLHEFQMSDGENIYYLFLKTPLINSYNMAWRGDSPDATLSDAPEWFRQLFIDMNLP